MTTRLRSLFRSACASLAACLAGSGALAAPRDPLEIPLTLRDGLPLIHARVDGRDAVLLLDSGGAAAVAMRPDWAGHPGAGAHPNTASAPPSQDAQGRPTQGARWALRSLELAGQAVEAPQAQTWGKARLPAGVDGYLGWGFLRSRKLVIDYGAQRLQLLDPQAALPAECGAQPQPFELLGSLPYVTLQAADGARVALGLDTGASRNVIQPAQAAAVQDGTLSLAGQALQPGPFASVALQLPVIQGFLGQDFFSRHRVCVDPAQRRLWVMPSASSTPAAGRQER